MTTNMHDDAEIVAWVAALPVQEAPLDWILEQLPGTEQRLLGDVVAMRVPGTGRWGFAIEQRDRLPPRAAQTFDQWARGFIERFLATGDPTIDGWHRCTQDEHGEAVDAYYAVCVTTDMPDMSFLDDLDAEHPDP